MFRRLRTWLFRRRKPILVASLSIAALYAWARWGPMDALFDTPRSTVLLDRNGELLGASVARDGQWRFPPMDTVPERFALCITQFEDRHFNDHFGVWPQSLLRAVQQNARAGRTVRGGSTITMQVARMSRGPGARSYRAKSIEILMALRMETRMSKQEILALYANNAPFGANVVGLEAAAWRWFGRAPRALSWAECATLAVLPNAPSAIYPGKGQEALREKRDRLLARLLEIRAIDSTEFALAKEEPLPGRPMALPRLAPHLLATLARQGMEGRLLRTTLDATLQHQAADITERYAMKLLANEVHNAAVLVIDVPSGEVLAYVGNLASSSIDHARDVDIVRARRSTGSLLKPFLHADMLQSGELMPATLLADVPTQYDGFNPRNFHEGYTGAVPADEALARSLNVPAVRNLRKHGVERALRTLRAMGMRSIDRSASNYGLSLVIGGAECTLLELGGAYASMARTLRNFGRGGSAYRSGDIHDPIILAGSTDTGVADTSGKPPLSAGSIHFTLAALREVERPSDEQGWRAFATSERIAWKTGTSLGHRDAWAIGVSDRWCVAVWTGNASGEGRPGLTGTLAAAPLMFDLFGVLPEGLGFEPPYDELVRAPICRASGHLAAADCDVVDTSWTTPQGLRTTACPYHHRVHIDATGRWRMPAGEGHATAWFVLPPAMERYYVQQHPTYRPLPPFRDGRTDDGNVMEVLYPESGARLLIPTELDGSRGKAVVELAHRENAAVVYWDLDGIYLGTTTGEHRKAIDPPDGQHTLTLTDDRGRVLRHSFAAVSRDRDQ